MNEKAEKRAPESASRFLFAFDLLLESEAGCTGPCPSLGSPTAEPKTGSLAGSSLGVIPGNL